jgi:O-antigen ligase
MSFALFIALNAILLIRPEEIEPDIAGLRVYLVVITLNVVTALPALIARLRPDELARRPLTLLVLALLLATFLSQLVQGRVEESLEFSSEFGKVVVYYLLLVSVVDSARRLRAFLGFLVLFIAVVAVLGLLQYHGVIDNNALRPVVQRVYDASTGQMSMVPRLCSAGIFNDPNDLCLILTLGVVCCLYRAASARGSMPAIAWLTPIALFGYAIMLTKSRGGLLGLMSAVVAFLVARFGWRRALPVAIAGVPLIILAVGGRQAKLDLDNEDTGYARLMLWGEGIGELARQPRSWLTGLGAGEYVEEAGLAAHNSFVQAYVELGLFGGSAFFVAFLSAARMLYRLRREGRPPRSPRLAVFPPYLLAAVVGYCGGMFSLSRNYVVPTYLCLGIAEAYLALAMPKPPPEFRVSRTWLTQTALLGVGGLLFLKFFTQLMGNLWS